MNNQNILKSWLLNVPHEVSVRRWPAERKHTPIEKLQDVELMFWYFPAVKYYSLENQYDLIKIDHPETKAPNDSNWSTSIHVILLDQLLRYLCLIIVAWL